MSEPGDDELGERLISREPVIVRRRVQWGDCDPAQVVYTPRFADYGVSAVQWFWHAMRSAGGPDLAAEDLLTPIKYMAFTFDRVLRPGDLFDMAVHVTSIRTRTFDLQVDATGMDGSPRFTGRFAPILVSARSFTSRPIPAALRPLLESYRDRFPTRADEKSRG